MKNLTDADRLSHVIAAARLIALVANGDGAADSVALHNTGMQRAAEQMPGTHTERRDAVLIGVPYSVTSFDVDGVNVTIFSRDDSDRADLTPGARQAIPTVNEMVDQAR